jgi:hypothetical protein
MVELEAGNGIITHIGYTRLAAGPRGLSGVMERPTAQISSSGWQSGNQQLTYIRHNLIPMALV